MADKINNPSDEYQPTQYLSLTTYLDYLGITESEQDSMAGELKHKYEIWVNEANRKVESALYPYADSLPLDKNSEEFAFAKSMAINYVRWQKALSEAADNANGYYKSYMDDRTDLKKVMKSQPTGSTKRHVSGTSFEERVVPYSQSFGLGDLL